jgi:hypothetical protein
MATDHPTAAKESVLFGHVVAFGRGGIETLAQQLEQTKCVRQTPSRIRVGSVGAGSIRINPHPCGQFGRDSTVRYQSTHFTSSLRARIVRLTSGLVAGWQEPERQADGRTSRECHRARLLGFRPRRTGPHPAESDR